MCLYDRGWTADRARQLLRLIDWMMDLPPELQLGFHEEIHQWQEEQLERLAQEKGFEEGQRETLQENITTSLQVRFGTSGKRLASRVREITGSPAASDAPKLNVIAGFQLLKGFSTMLPLVAMCLPSGPRSAIDFPWCDSFAAARNECLRHANGGLGLLGGCRRSAGQCVEN